MTTFYNYGWLRKVDIVHDLDRLNNHSKIAMQAAQLKVFLAKLKSEPLLQSQLTAEGADIVSTAKVAALFIDSNESTAEAVIDLSDQEIKDQIFDALNKGNNPSISPILIWATLLTVLLILIGVFLNLKY
ncbi:MULTISPECIES: transaldolase [unclassified Prochlorococcus]|uniref:transaldolase n=1 Tax=unclassified Prochlorococcus TaxID=2627481 RepID=UPI001F4C55E0|nr:MULTISPECIES: transaldolase [unclassified Prochlorococcus]